MQEGAELRGAWDQASFMGGFFFRFISVFFGRNESPFVGFFSALKLKNKTNHQSPYRVLIRPTS